MAPKQTAGGGMAGYVQKKDATSKTIKQEQQPEAHDDLRVPVPTNAQAANSAQQRRHPLDADSRQVQQDAKQRANGQQPFYAASAGSLESNFETPTSIYDVRPAENSSAPLKRQAANANPHSAHVGSSEYSSGVEDGEGDGSEGEDLPNDPLDNNGLRLSPSARQIMEIVDSRKEGNSISSWQVKGDSYPSTTSGPPSHYEPPTRNTQPSNLGRGAAEQTAGATPKAQQRQSPVRPLQQQKESQAQLRPRQAQQFEDQSMPSGAHFQRPDANHGLVNPQDFQFAPQMPPPDRTAQAPVVFEGRQPVSTSRARQPLAPQHAQPAKNTQVPNGRGAILPAPAAAKQSAPREQTDVSATGVPVRTNAKPMQPASRVEQQLPTYYSQQRLETFDDTNYKQRDQQPQPQPAAERPPPSKQPEQPLGTSDGPEHEQQEPVADEADPMQLDYDEATLIAMEFSDLKSQPFDTAPADQPMSLHGVEQNDPIDTQMAAVAGLDPPDQYTFLNSLAIDEWEEAGDWFLGKFGETLQRMKQLRQERRKAAHKFEKEIESRHVAVTKKRKFTETALDCMKASGSMVLGGTPQKNKKSE